MRSSDRGRQLTSGQQAPGRAQRPYPHSAVRGPRSAVRGTLPGKHGRRIVAPDDQDLITVLPRPSHAESAAQ